MKKLFLILVFCLCGSLYADEYCTGDVITYSLDITGNSLVAYRTGKLTAVIPYENGYILKILDEDDNLTYEIFVTEGSVFYSYRRTFDKNFVWYIQFFKNTITKLHPNRFETEKEKYIETDRELNILYLDETIVNEQTNAGL